MIIRAVLRVLCASVVRAVERAANLRLHIFVWDRMLERLQALKQ
jgi:hypothetical protein